MRIVPAFTIASNFQKGTCVQPPPKTNFFTVHDQCSTNKCSGLVSTCGCCNTSGTLFRKFYKRRDLPLRLSPYNSQNVLWDMQPISNLEYDYYLPIFFDGIRETKKPYDQIAKAACRDLIQASPEKTFKTLPQLIVPIRKSLQTRDPKIIQTIAELIQLMVNSSPVIGIALVPYYRHILPMFGYFQNYYKRSSGREKSLADTIAETLEILERNGGPDAYLNIKYIIATYESCINYTQCA